MNYKKIIAWVPTWVLFWVGDVASHVVHAKFLDHPHDDDGSWSEFWRSCILAPFWKVYQMSMYWSSELSIWGDVGLWEVVDKEGAYDDSSPSD